MKTEDSELLEIVDRSGNVIGLNERSVIHGNSSLIHRVVHVLVFNRNEELLLQKRSVNKDVAPGKWDTSVGGHVSPGEDILEAAKREMKEELGISECRLRYLYKYLYSNDYETELITTFTCVYNGNIHFDTEEIDEVRFWSLQDIKESLEGSLFSSNFKIEINHYLNFSNHSVFP
jgi:isopentenyl-diphosphate delta-isomerase type 1